MTQRFRSCKIYFEGRRYAYCEDGEIDLPTGGEAVVADGEYAGSTDGVMVSKVTMNHIVPVGDTYATGLIQKMLDNKRVKVEVGIVGDKIFSWDEMTLDSGNIKWDGKANRVNGSFTLTGGKPNLV